MDEIRANDGKWIKAPTTGAPPITSANARTMAQKRWAKFRQAAAVRVAGAGAAIDPTVTTAADAWGLVVEKQYVALMDSEKPRGRDLLDIGKAIGAMPADHELRQASETAGNTVNIINVPEEVARALLDIKRMLSGTIPAQIHATNGDVIEG